MTEVVSNMSAEEAALLDLRIIVALMRRMGAEEVILPAASMPPQNTTGLHIRPLRDGSVVVKLITDEVADAVVEAHGRLKS